MQNPAPAAVTGLEVIGGFGSVMIKFDEPKDLDWEGTLVYMSDKSGVKAGRKPSSMTVQTASS